MWSSSARSFMRCSRGVLASEPIDFEIPGFWTGVDSVFDWSGEIDFGRKYDPYGIFNDWCTVGDDLRNAFEDVERRKTSPV